MRKYYNIMASVFIVIICVFLCFLIFDKGDYKEPVSLKDYEEEIRILEDTINSLRKNIAQYEAKLEAIDCERQNIKREIKQILEANEKTNIELSNGDWDTNISFLSEYLSEKDSLGE